MCLDNICELAIDGSIAKILKSQNNSVLQYQLIGHEVYPQLTRALNTHFLWGTSCKQSCRRVRPTYFPPKVLLFSGGFTATPLDSVR